MKNSILILFLTILTISCFAPERDFSKKGDFFENKNKLVDYFNDILLCFRDKNCYIDIFIRTDTLKLFYNANIDKMTLIKGDSNLIDREILEKASHLIDTAKFYNINCISDEYRHIGIEFQFYLLDKNEKYLFIKDSTKLVQPYAKNIMQNARILDLNWYCISL